MGLYSMAYAAGAVAAGLSVPLLITAFGYFRTTAATVAIYALGTLLIVWIPVTAVFVLLQIALGWGNAGARVARNTIMMQLVPNELIGRTNTFFAGVGFALRVSFIGLFTRTVSHTGEANSLLCMALVLFAALAGVIASRSAIIIHHSAPDSTMKNSSL